MSFRKASDSTYIAQLLGRMIRTPMQMRIQVDETLNEVKLFLPHFNQETVEEVISSLKEIEGGDLPTDVSGSGIINGAVQVLSVRPRVGSTTPTHHGLTMFYVPAHSAIVPLEPASAEELPGSSPIVVTNPSSSNQAEVTHSILNAQDMDIPTSFVQDEASIGESAPQTEPTIIESGSTENETSIPEGTIPSSCPNVQVSAIDRVRILDFINSQGYINYNVRKTKVYDYLKSLFKLTRLLTQSGIAVTEYKDTLEKVAELIRDYVQTLKDNGEYEPATKKVMEFRLKQSIIDTFGERVVNQISQDLFSTTDSDVDRQYNLSEAKLGSEGIGNIYGQLYGDPNDFLQYKLDVILYVSQSQNLEHLQDWAKNRFHAVKTQYRMNVVHAEEKIKEKWEKIVKDGDAVSEIFLNLPYDISVGKESGGIEFYDHLYVDNDGKATFILNGWETLVIEQEKQNPDFLYWLRNPDRKPWALCIPYEMDNEQKPMYPDFLIVRNTNHGIVVDILEPHNPQKDDNLPKAKGLARYAASEQRIGRIQLIRIVDGIGGSKIIKRLDMTDSLVRDKVLHCVSREELNSVFLQYGI